MVLKCAQIKPKCAGGKGSTCNLMRVTKQSVPSEPASRLQKLKLGFPAINELELTNVSSA